MLCFWLLYPSDEARMFQGAPDHDSLGLRKRDFLIFEIHSQVLPEINVFLYELLPGLPFWKIFVEDFPEGRWLSFHNAHDSSQ